MFNVKNKINIIKIMKKLLLLVIVSLLFLSCSNSYPQIKVTWETQSTALWYRIYYCAGDDSSKFPIKDGITHDQVWDWQTGSTLYPYFYIKNDGYGKFYRVGVIAESFSGDLSTMVCKTYARIKVEKPTGVRVQEIKE